MHKHISFFIIDDFMLSKKAAGCSLLLTYIQIGLSFLTAPQDCCPKPVLFSLFSDLALKFILKI